MYAPELADSRTIEELNAAAIKHCLASNLLNKVRFLSLIGLVLIYF